MSALAVLNQDILNTILGHLALLFLTAGADPEKARQAAADALGAYDVQTDEELRLAAEVISFGFHALQALAQAAESDLSLNRILRLRGSAVSLSREAHKSQRKLDQVQRARRAGPQPTPAEPASQTTGRDTRTNDDIVRAVAEAQRVAQQIIARDGGKRWSQTGQKRALALRMAEKARQAQAQHAAAARPNGVTPAIPASAAVAAPAALPRPADGGRSCLA